MNDINKLKNKLAASIDFAVKHGEDFNASGWNSQEGVLMNHNEAKLVLEMIMTIDRLEEKIEAHKICFEDFIPPNRQDEANLFVASYYNNSLAKDKSNKNL